MANAFDQSQYPTREPDQLAIGNRWTWRKALPDYPPAAYTLTYEALSHAATPCRFTLTATDDGTDHIIEEAVSATVTYEPGVYAWVAFITRDSDSARIEVGRGTFTVKPDPATDNSDPRSLAARMVSNLSAAIEGLSTTSVISYSIGDRSVTKRDLPELRRELRYWQGVREAEITAERGARGLPARRRIQAVFR